jgi:Short-chain dehydrogenases of various substrate specificities
VGGGRDARRVSPAQRGRVSNIRVVSSVLGFRSEGPAQKTSARLGPIAPKFLVYSDHQGNLKGFGPGQQGPLVALREMSSEQRNEVINTNLRGVFLCTKAAAEQMIAQGNGGAIVNITSSEAHNPAPEHSH